MDEYNLKLTIRNSDGNKKVVDMSFYNIDNLHETIMEADKLISSDLIRFKPIRRVYQRPEPSLSYSSTLKDKNGLSYEISILVNIDPYKNQVIVPDFASNMIGWLFHKTNKISNNKGELNG